MIEIRNLTKLYGEQTAVNNISFSVKKGEIVGFLGPNGAGKSTTMKIITCYMPPTSGDVSVGGLDAKENSLEVRRMIGYLPEANPLYVEMNVIDFLFYIADLRMVSKDRQNGRVRDLIELCGLGDVLHKDIGQLSKGYRQRVGLAQAMIHEPPILILDEPTIGLDPNQVLDIRQLIKTLGQEKTVILSTHIMTEVEATCDRVVIINKGNIVADGPLTDLQNEFSGKPIITVELLGGSSKIEETLRKVPQIEDVRELYDPSGVKQYRLVAAAGSDPRSAIFDTAVANNWKIVGMSRETRSLEQLFHQLTTTQG